MNAMDVMLRERLDDDVAATAATVDAMSFEWRTTDERNASDSDSDEDNGDNDDDELMREWAATEIQRAWRSMRCISQHQTPADAHSEHSVVPADDAPTRVADVCCSCFGPIEISASGDRAAGSHVDSDDPLFCTACLYVMTIANPKTRASSHGAATPLSSAIDSPLPKLSKLVQVEARYQSQLELLRAQRALLQQQQDEMANRKAAEAQQLEAERTLARERRRLFQRAAARRKRDEALKLGLAVSSCSGGPEIDNDDSSVGSKTPVDAVSKPTRTKRMKEMLPIPFVRTLALSSTKATESAGNGSSNTPGTLLLLPRLDDRRRQVRGCYAQDLTPLVNGHKPKLLPVPSPLPSNSNSNSSSSGYGHSTSVKKTKSSQHARGATSKTRPNVRLRPIVRKLQHDNQQDDRDARASLYTRHAAPLTAEIKPIAWVHALGKGVLDNDDPHSCSNTGAKTHQSPTKPLLSTDGYSFAQLQPVPEASTRAPSHLSVDLQLQHQLPPTTMLASDASTSNTNSVTLAPVAAAPWEYSTDRLASLLQKYNVSVSAATASATAASATTSVGSRRV